MKARTEVKAAMRRIVGQREAAHYLGLSTRTVYALMKSGKLRSVRIGEVSRARYDIVDLDAFIESCKVGGETAK